jgi:hydroxymethylbilane synthase
LKPLRIGTRSSALALWQANHVRDRLIELHGIDCEIIRMRTSGDQFPTGSVALIGDKGVFIKEIEDALLSGAIDLAVHSMKDVPTENPYGVAFPAITKREDPRDCLISRHGQKLRELRHGARVGTSSLRRQAQLQRHRADLHLANLRGNVDTRLRKLAAGECDAIVLALAGVTRLKARDKVSEILSTEIMLPAVGQGALGMETRSNDSATARLVAALNDAQTRACVTAERALLRELGGGCQVPLGAWARMEGSEITLDARVLSPDGEQDLRRTARAPLEHAETLGKRLGRELIEAGADRILRLVGRSLGQQ